MQKDNQNEEQREDKTIVDNTSQFDLVKEEQPKEEWNSISSREKNSSSDVYSTIYQTGYISQSQNNRTEEQIERESIAEESVSDLCMALESAINETLGLGHLITIQTPTHRISYSVPEEEYLQRTEQEEIRRRASVEESPL
ncbi:hypothetical protein NEOKW01_0979 [Nematocida sp. AWRm80]|nr:hypothetical protein NEOKW01_0979 [Nematocida sp. AWRm80]